MTRVRVLFLCTGNSARSQMAEALLRHAAGDRFEAHSAGIEPKGVHALTLEVLREAGIDTSSLRSKHLREYQGRVTFDCLITVCGHADQNCPTWTGVSQRLHWPYDDPAAAQGTQEERLAVFRRVRDEIAARIGAWLRTQGQSTPGTWAKS